jgi:hypothetical protein
VHREISAATTDTKHRLLVYLHWQKSSNPHEPLNKAQIFCGKWVTSKWSVYKHYDNTKKLLSKDILPLVKDKDSPRKFFFQNVVCKKKRQYKIERGRWVML